MDNNLIAELLTSLNFVMSGGTTRVLPGLLSLFTILATIEVVFLGIYWRWSGENGMALLMSKVVLVGFLLHAMQHWQMWCNAIRNFFIAQGAEIGGGNLAVADVLNPVKLIEWGFAVTALVLKPKTGFFGIVTSPVETLVVGLSCILLMLASIAMAAFVFKALVSFTLVSAMCIVLVPFGVGSRTAFLAERAFGLVCAHAIKLGMLALVMSAMLPIMIRFQLPPDATYRHLFELLGAACMVLGIMLSVDRIATHMAQGSPSLHGNGITNLVRMSSSTVLRSLSSSSSSGSSSNGAQSPAATSNGTRRL